MKLINDKCEFNASLTVESSFIMIAAVIIIFLVITISISLRNKAADYAKEKFDIEVKVSEQMTDRSESGILDEGYIRAPEILYTGRAVKDIVR